jgi:hypothetical protein
MRGYTHVEIIGRVGKFRPADFVLHAAVSDRDARPRPVSFTVLWESPPLPSGTWVLVAGRLDTFAQISAASVVRVDASPERPELSDREMDAFRHEEIALEGYWQSRRGQPVWVSAHTKNVRKKAP